MSIVEIHVSVKIKLVCLVHDIRKRHNATSILIVFWIPVRNVRVHYQRSYSQNRHEPDSSAD
jgi:hypothetical protein